MVLAEVNSYLEHIRQVYMIIIIGMKKYVQTIPRKASNIKMSLLNSLFL